MMFQRTRPSCRRSAFTLVELMVVILIISILSALLTVAVSKGITVAKRTRNMTELRQLAAAIDAFKADYKVDYIPSTLVLFSKQSDYTNSSSFQPATDSYAYLLRLWPRLFATGDVNWNGLGTKTGVILKGDQCLVFFLGGIPAFDSATGAPLCTGFATNPADPSFHIANPTSGGKPTPVKGPYFEFDSSRLALVHKASLPMLSYLDTFGTTNGKGTWLAGLPYLYFSSYGTRNGYNKYSSLSFFDSEWTSIDYGGSSNPAINTVFCPPQVQNNTSGGPLRFFPYAQGVNQYLNPTGYQIISGGPDMQYGQGTLNPTSTAGAFWTPATAANSNASGATGADDQSNFYESLLGVPSIN